MTMKEQEPFIATPEVLLDCLVYWNAIFSLSVLAATGGALTSVVVEEMLSEAHEGETSPLGPIALTAGFAVFALISVYVG